MDLSDLTAFDPVAHAALLARSGNVLLTNDQLDLIWELASVALDRIAPNSVEFTRVNELRKLAEQTTF